MVSGVQCLPTGALFSLPLWNTKNPRLNMEAGILFWGRGRSIGFIRPLRLPHSLPRPSHLLLPLASQTALRCHRGGQGTIRLRQSRRGPARGHRHPRLWTKPGFEKEDEALFKEHFPDEELPPQE